MAVVVSDLVGTLTTGSPVRAVVDWVREHQSQMRANLYMARIMPNYMLAKRGMIDMQKWAQGLMVSCLPLIREATPELVEHMAEWSVDNELWPQRREEVLARLAGHVAEGAQVFIGSSAIQPQVQAFASRIGAEPIGSPVEIVAGRLRLVDGLAAGEGKIQRVMDELGVDRLNAAYGDTWADIPMLEHADRPVAVFPDEVLKKTAVERGWEILGERT